jgi:hypothetical protein
VLEYPDLSNEHLKDMADIRLVPGNAIRTPEADLQPLIDSIRAAFPELSVVYGAKEQRGYGVTWWEVLNIYLANHPLAAIPPTYVATKVLDLAIEWVRKRFEKSRRPRSISIYGPNNEVLKKIVLKERDADPEDVDEYLRRVNSSTQRSGD